MFYHMSAGHQHDVPLWSSILCCCGCGMGLRQMNSLGPSASDRIDLTSIDFPLPATVVSVGAFFGRFLGVYNMLGLGLVISLLASLARR